MQYTITFPTGKREALYDITDRVASVVTESRVRTGLCAVYAQGATAAIMIQENWDDSVQNDVVSLLRKLAPQGDLGARPAGRQCRQSPEGGARGPERDDSDYRTAARAFAPAEYLFL